jgi:type III restriction enzyme
MANLLQFTTPSVRLTRSTLLEIFERTSRKDQAVENPQEFASVAVNLIKEKLAEQLVHGIKYEKINDWYEMTRLETEIESWLDNLVPSSRSLYDFIPYDSQIEKEFVQDLERREDVRLYFKLPPWFTVPTPVGEYNPDWAIVIEQRDEHGEPIDRPLLYLVCETKGPAGQY